MSIRSIIEASCPDVLYDRQLTPNEQKVAQQNLQQETLYPQDEQRSINQEIRDAHVDEEVQALKKEVQAESIYILEKDSDYDPIDQEDIEP